MVILARCMWMELEWSLNLAKHNSQQILRLLGSQTICQKLPKRTRRAINAATEVRSEAEILDARKNFARAN